MAEPLALIVGVGAATGRAVCERLAGHFSLAMVARSNNVIDELAERLPDARAYACDVTDLEAWRSMLMRVVAEQGLPERILVNTEGGGWGDYNEIDLARFAASFEVNVVSVLAMIQTLFPHQSDIHGRDIPGGRRVLISSSPAAYQSSPRFLGLAPSRAAQRVLAETLHEMLADHGLAFGLLNISGAIDEPNMRQAFSEEPDAFFIQPSAIAERVWELFTGAFAMQTVITPDG